ncbi:hypothetical protein ACH4MJ_04260 [Streptomyces anulatus]
MPGMIPPPPNYPPMVPTVPAPPPTPVTKKTPPHPPRRNPAAQHLDQHPRLRKTLYNATAAAAGWWCGLGPWMANGITHYGTHDVQRGIWVGVGLTLISLVVEWRTHTWRSPDRAILPRIAGWAGRIPLATALLALALYGPDATF